jgi:hypothetical protein
MTNPFFSALHPSEAAGTQGSAAFTNSTIIIDLSNDSVTVPSSTDGLTTNFSSAVTTVSILEGLTNVTNLWSITATPGTGVTGSFTSNTYTVGTMSTDSGTVTFTATRAGYATLTAVFTIAKARAGSPGSSVTVYDIRASQGIIKKNAAGTFTPATITFEGLSITGAGAPAPYSGRFIIAASTDNGATYSPVYTSSTDQTSYTYTLSGTTVTHIRATLYAGGAAAGTTSILDQEVFPVASDGINAVSGFLTNEVHNVSADLNGGSYSLTGSGGTFKVFNGTTDVTTSATFSVVAPATKNGLTMSVAATTGIYSLSGASWTTDSESFTLRAVYNSVTIDLVYSISKSKTGATGGAGPQGPSLQLTASAQAFTFTDNVANPSSQTITLTAALQNLTGTATFTTTPSVPLTGSDLTRTLTVENFGTNRQVTIQVTVAGVTDRITIVRLERDIFSGNANRVPFSRIEGGQGWATGGVFAPTPTLITSDGRSFITAEPPFTAANQDVYLFNSPRFAVSAGERLSVSGRIQAFALTGGANPSFWQYYIEFYSATSTILGNQPIGSGTTSISESILHSAFATAPTDTRSAQLVLLYRSSAAGPARMAILEPMVTSALAGQTAHPPFTPGPNAQDGATVGATSGVNLLDSGGRTLTDRDISNTSQRVAVRQWAFNNNSLNGWSGVAQSGSAPTVTTGSEYVTFTANSTDTSFMSPDNLGVDGRVGRYLRMILSATAQLSASMRDVEIYFSTNAYAPIDGTRSKNGTWIPANHPTNGTPFEVLLDMHTLTAGGNAWRDEIVRRLRIDFDGTVPETIRIHEISIVYLGTATVGAPPGTPVGAYTDAALIQPAVASAATTALWPSVTGTGRPADNADVTRTVLPSLNRGPWSSSAGAYPAGDIVTRDGSSYTCIIAHTASAGNGPPGANWTLLANAGAQGATGVSAPPTKALGTGGAVQLDPIRLNAGQTLTVEASLFLDTGSTSGICSLSVQWSLNSANSWTTMTNGTDTESAIAFEAVELFVPNATFTNTSGTAQLYDIRTTSARQSRTVNLPLSYMRVI